MGEQIARFAPGLLSPVLTLSSLPFKSEHASFPRSRRKGCGGASMTLTPWRRRHRGSETDGADGGCRRGTGTRQVGGTRGRQWRMNAVSICSSPPGFDGHAPAMSATRLSVAATPSTPNLYRCVMATHLRSFREFFAKRGSVSIYPNGARNRILDSVLNFALALAKRRIS